MAKMWAGLTSGVTDSVADDFNSSISFDSRMYKQDITGSIAHAAMLSAQGIISPQDKEQLTEGLLSIEPTGRGNVHFLELTDRGMRVADLLIRLEEVLDGPSQDGSRSRPITQDQSVSGSSLP